MGLELRKGMKVWKSDLKGEIYRVRLSKENSMRFFALLQKAGYIDIKGKVVVIKKDLRI